MNFKESCLDIIVIIRYTNIKNVRAKENLSIRFKSLKTSVKIVAESALFIADTSLSSV